MNKSRHRRYWRRWERYCDQAAKLSTATVASAGMLRAYNDRARKDIRRPRLEVRKVL